MQFILIGFSHDSGSRVFQFEGIAEDRTRTRFAVRTDLSLIRNYGIQVQELPMLCRKLLEQREEGQRERTVTFTEDAMRVHAAACAAERDAAQRRRPPRRPGFAVSTPRQP
jgi:hypothetical protein